MATARIVVKRRNETEDADELKSLAAVDLSFPTRVVITTSKQYERLVLSPCGDLTNELDDVREVGTAAASGASAAFSMGATVLSLSVEPQIVNQLHPVDGRAYCYADLVAALAVQQQAYIPLQAREGPLAKKPKLSSFSWSTPDNERQQLYDALTEGLNLARDIGSGDPERMAAPLLAAHVQSVCSAAGVQVEVVSDLDVLKKEYPLLMAVGRASLNVESHRPRVVRLSWCGEGPVEKTILLAGKGVTYDTGGADIKVGGSMAGMRTDKCGAAAAAGFVLACAKSPKHLTKGLKVVAELGCVRNSTGSHSYVADEILTGHSGKRVLVANTDMEGRLVLADCLSHLRLQALSEQNPNPTLLSIATLTGHAVLCYGRYATGIDNGAAKAAGGVAPKLATAGTLLGQPMEVSMLRKDDFDFISAGSSITPISKLPDSYDVLQSNTQPSSKTERGHQFPAAFLAIASGLQDHSSHSKTPLPYCHIDLSESILDSRGTETGSPILALYGHFVMKL